MAKAPQHTEHPMELQDPQLTLDRLVRQDLRNDPEQSVWILAMARHEALAAMREAKTENEAQGWRAYSVSLEAGVEAFAEPVPAIGKQGFWVWGDRR
jgi:hypothetical protein